MDLLHFGEDPTISLFVPRRLAHRPELPPLVWAIDQEHAPLYYFPRDCPRVTYHAVATTTAADRERFLGHTTAQWVMAIESGWLERMRAARLFAYTLPGATFSCIDQGAGTYTSAEPVTPLAMETVGDLLLRHVQAGVELRLTPSLWPLYHAVIASTLQFSIIRMRHAAPQT